MTPPVDAFAGQMKGVVIIGLSARSMTGTVDHNRIDFIDVAILAVPA